MKLFSLSRRHITPMVVLCCFVLLGSQPAPAQVAVAKRDPGFNNPPPPGAVLDLSGSPIPGGGNGTYQHYTVDFTATLTSTAITLAFRDDPAQVSVANVSVMDLTSPNGNLLVNGNFSQGPVGSNTPTGWTYANQYGAIAGGGVASGSALCYTSAFCWLDGAVQAFDAISQTIATTIGHTYQISFDVAEDSATFAAPGNPLFPPTYPGSDCYLAAHGGPSPCKFSNISINGDTTDPAGNGIDVTAYAQGGLPGTQITYTNDTNIADFTSNVASYATFSNFSNGDGCASSPFTPTSAELAGPNACRVYTGGTLTGLSGSNWILASFSSPTSAIVVFPDIDHYGSAYDGYQYKIEGSNDLSAWSMLFDATSVNGCVSSCVVVGGEPFTLGNFTGTAPTTVNNVLTPGAGPGGSVGYIAQFQFGTAYKYYAFGASTVAFAQGNPDQELSAIGTPATQVQSTPPTNFTTTSTTTYTTVPTAFNTIAGQFNESDVSFAPFADLTFPPGSDPTTMQFQTTNKCVSNSDQYEHDTPFATFKSFDVASNDALCGTPGNGAKYEVRCFDARNPIPSENDCPFASAPNTHIGHKVIIDSTGGTPPAITPGTTVGYLHWPIGPALTASATSWSPSRGTGPGSNPNCTSVTNGVNGTPAYACDIENILITKYGGVNGPNTYAPNGSGSDKRKGDYFLGYNVPEPCSAWRVNGTLVHMPCVQSSSPFFVSSVLTGGLTFNFVVNPAQCPVGMVCGNGWTPAPIKNLFYHFDQCTSAGPDPCSSAPDYPNVVLLQLNEDLNDLATCFAGSSTCPVTSVTQPGTSSTLPVEFTAMPPVPEPEGEFLLQASGADTVQLRDLNIQLLNAGQCPDPFPNDPNRPVGGWVPPCYSTKLYNAKVFVDNTPPTVINLALTPNTQIPGKTITASYTCADNSSTVVNSGLASCGTNLNLNLGAEPGPLGPQQLSDTPFTVPQVNGPQVYSVTATDVAGNKFTAKANYFAGYQFTGFGSPVSDPAPGVTVAPAGGFINPAINVIKTGRTVPIKWQVLDGNGVGVAGLTLNAVNGGPGGTVVLTAQNSTVCAHDTVDNSILVDAAGNSGLQDLGGGNYQFNWKTVLPSGACVDLMVNPGDGTQHHAFFQAK